MTANAFNVPYFNTSYVVIKLLIFYHYHILVCYFNTSYVVIKPNTALPVATAALISIHHMLLLSGKWKRYR